MLQEDGKVTARRQTRQLKGCLEEEYTEKQVLVCPCVEDHQSQHQPVENFVLWFGYLLGGPRKYS